MEFGDIFLFIVKRDNDADLGVAVRVRTAWVHNLFRLPASKRMVARSQQKGREIGVGCAQALVGALQAPEATRGNFSLRYAVGMVGRCLTGDLARLNPNNRRRHCP